MAFVQQNFIDAVVDALKGVGMPVYSTIAPPNEAPPYILVTIVGDIPAVYFPNSDDFSILLQVDLYDLRHGSEEADGGIRALREVGEKVKACLHRQFLTVENAGYVNGRCTRRGDVRVETGSMNRIIYEFIFMGSET